jgi:hypothetical protein
MTKYFMMQMRGSHGWRKEKSSAADHVETTSNIGLEEIRQDSEQGGKKRGSEGRHEMSHVQKALDTLNREMVDIKQTLKTIISILPQQWKEESQASGAGLQSTVGLSAILATPTINRQAHKHAEHMCSKTGANSPDTSGKFEFDQIPVGNSDMEKNEALQQEIDALKREIIRKDEEQLPLQSSDTPEVQHVRHKMGEEMNTRMDSLVLLYEGGMERERQREKERKSERESARERERARWVVRARYPSPESQPTATELGQLNRIIALSAF